MSTKTTAPKVAVITRTKDRALLLERAIKSVHNQTMTDFVHVIINDAGSKKPVDDLVEKHKKLINGRVKVIHNDQSNGMEAASNKAIKSVDSTYIAIHDDDDTWHPDFLKETTEYLEKTQAKGVVVTTDKIIEEISDNKVKKISQDRWLPGVDTISLYKQCRDNYATPITFLYKRSVFQKVGYYDEGLTVAGDWDFALRFLCEYDIDFLNREYALAFYHHRTQKKGINANSVLVDGGYRHRYFITKIANKYLRQEFKDGKLGLGYIISMLHDDRAQAENSTNNYVAQLNSQLEAMRSSVLQKQEETTKHIERVINQRTSIRERVKKKSHKPDN